MDVVIDKNTETIDKKLLEAEKAEANGMKWYTQEEYDEYFKLKEKTECLA